MSTLSRRENEVYDGTENECEIFVLNCRNRQLAKRQSIVNIEEFPQAKEAIDVKVQYQNNVDLFLSTSEYFPFSICARSDHCQSYILRGNVVLLPSGASEENCGEIAIDSSPRQRADTIFTSSVAVFSRKKHLCHGSSDVLF
jgi:hypothetical protein